MQVCNMDPAKVAEVIEYIAEKQDYCPNPKATITGGKIRKMFGLTREQYETILILSGPAMRYRTKINVMKMTRHMAAKKKEKEEAQKVCDCQTSVG